MNLIDKKYFMELHSKRDKLVLIFILLLIAFAVCYFFSFFFNTLFIPMIVGVIAVIVLVMFYYTFIFDKNKLLKLYKNMLTGIMQDDTYTFKAYDDITEHDGVTLKRVICTFTDESEVFERTLYFIEALPYPTLTKGQQITVKTHQNIIVNIED